MHPHLASTQRLRRVASVMGPLLVALGISLRLGVSEVVSRRRLRRIALRHREEMMGRGMIRLAMRLRGDWEMRLAFGHALERIGVWEKVPG